MRYLSLVAALVTLLLAAAPALAHGGDQVIPNGIERIGMARQIELGLNDVDVDVAVIDTGVDVYHPDLNVVGGHDCTGEWKDKPTYDDYGRIQFPHQDFNGHGTHVAGIIGAKNNNAGVVGVAPGARIWGVKVLDEGGSGTIDSIICGLDWVTKHADVIDVANLSLGGDFGDALVAPCFDPNLPADQQDPLLLNTPKTMVDPHNGQEYENPFWTDQRLHQAICDATRAGVVIVVAAGNGGQDAYSGRPSAYDEPIVVSNFSDFDGHPGGIANNASPCSADGWDDTLFTYDNGGIHPLADSYHGEQVDVSAPGTCVLSTYLGATYTYLTGTSMASPTVAGAVALFKSIYPNASVDAVKGWIQACGEAQPEDFGDPDEFHEPLLHVCGLPNPGFD